MRTENAAKRRSQKESAPVPGKSKRANAENHRDEIIPPIWRELFFGVAVLAAFLLTPQVLGMMYQAGVL